MKNNVFLKIKFFRQMRLHKIKFDFVIKFKNIQFIY